MELLESQIFLEILALDAVCKVFYYDDNVLLPPYSELGFGNLQ